MLCFVQGGHWKTEEFEKVIVLFFFTDYVSIFRDTNGHI